MSKLSACALSSPNFRHLSVQCLCVYWFFFHFNFFTWIWPLFNVTILPCSRSFLRVIVAIVIANAIVLYLALYLVLYLDYYVSLLFLWHREQEGVVHDPSALAGAGFCGPKASGTAISLKPRRGTTSLIASLYMSISLRGGMLLILYRLVVVFYNEKITAAGKDFLTTDAKKS